MNSKDIFMIVLLLVILAIVYKVMQTMKTQTELVGGMAVKMGIAIKKPKPKRQQQEEEQITEDTDAEVIEEEEEQEETEEEEQTEEETQEEESEEENQEEEIEKVDSQLEDGNSVKDLEPRNHLIKVVKPETEVPQPEKIKKKFNAKKSKLKGYELIGKLLDTPLNAGDLKEKWKQEFGETPDEKIIYNLNYGLSLGVIKKHLIGKRFLYARPDMFDGDTLKQEYLPTT